MRFLPGDFEVLTTTSGTTATLTLRGELDMATVPSVEEALAALGDAPRRVVVDLRDLRFLDSMGLELFIALDARLAEQGRELVLIRGPRAVNRLFAVMELESVLHIVDEPPAE
jgi:anti-sigma B factor antagonist